MAKQTYTVHDEYGNTWVVKVGDPAFALVSRIKHPAVVLPIDLLKSGELGEFGTDYAALKLQRFTRAAELFPDDPDLAEALVRTVNLQSCLRELADLTITKE